MKPVIYLYIVIYALALSSLSSRNWNKSPSLLHPCKIPLSCIIHKIRKILIRVERARESRKVADINLT